MKLNYGETVLTDELYDLRELTRALTKAFPQIEALYLFGSRRYRTGSRRSDVDILVGLGEDLHIRPQELRAFSSDYCRALDLFVAEGGKAVSCANESHVRADSFPKGMADVTVNKVSELADVTKGAFFNHFDSKETLVTELMQMLLTRLDKQFDRLMAEEVNSDGCVTRAYIRAAFSEGAAERKIWGALLSLMASKDQVGWVWNNWLSERLKRHSKTDSRIELHVVRLAADGVWLERIMSAKSKNLKCVEEYLIEMTRIR